MLQIGEKGRKVKLEIERVENCLQTKTTTQKARIPSGVLTANVYPNMWKEKKTKLENELNLREKREKALTVCSSIQTPQRMTHQQRAGSRSANFVRYENTQTQNTTQFSLPSRFLYAPCDTETVKHFIKTDRHERQHEKENGRRNTQTKMNSN